MIYYTCRIKGYILYRIVPLVEGNLYFICLNLIFLYVFSFFIPKGMEKPLAPVREDMRRAFYTLFNK